MSAALTLVPADQPAGRAGKLLSITWAERTPAQPFADAIVAASYPLAPEPPTPHAALGAAMRHYAAENGLEAAAVDKGKKLAPWGLYVPREHSDRRKLSEAVLTARIVGGAGSEHVEFQAANGHGLTDFAMDTIAAKYREELSGLGQAALRAWFSGRVAPYFALVGKVMGGAYFVPRKAVPAWEPLRDVLQAHGHRCTELPAYDDNRNILLDVHDALDADVARTVERMERELSTITTHRGLDGMLLEADVLEAKLAAYDEVLGSRFDRTALVRFRAAVGAARLMVSPL